jgi:hypothetical protein
VDFDHVVAIQGAPGGSVLNKCEHAMSILNFGLTDVLFL